MQKYQILEQKIIISANKKWHLGIDELWQYRELFYFFIWRDVKVKYKQAFLGILWAILQPLSMAAIFSAIFGKKLDELNGSHSPFFTLAFCGLIFWQLFSSSVVAAASSMNANANIIKKIYFPRLIIPISSIGVVVFDFIFAYLVLLCLILVKGIEIDFLKFIFYTPLSILLIFITALGFGAWLSALNVKYKDFQYALPFLMQVLLFVHPVLYPARIIENPILAFLMKINPIANAIELLRSTFLTHNNKTFDWFYCIISLFVSFFVLAIGIYIFRKMENYFADNA